MLGAIAMMKTLLSILQDRDTFVKEIADRVDLKRKLIDLNAIGAASFGVYGAIIGSQHSATSGITQIRPYMITSKPAIQK
jgi:uncharacterized membrane protein